jgi:hypothetical protein
MQTLLNALKKSKIKEVFDHIPVVLCLGHAGSLAFNLLSVREALDAPSFQGVRAQTARITLGLSVQVT